MAQKDKIDCKKSTETRFLSFFLNTIKAYVIGER